MGREDAWLHYNSVKNFRTSNWARVSAVRLQIHLSALPQMIFQCYTVNELLHDRELKKISWFSWISIALSTISLSMYHHTLALAQDKTLDRDHDQENASRTSPSECKDKLVNFPHERGPLAAVLDSFLFMHFSKSWKEQV